MKHTWLYWLMTGLGLVCCSFSLLRRGMAEHRDRAVAYAISYDTLYTLSSAEAFTTTTTAPEVWLDILSQAGLGYLAAEDGQAPVAKALAEAAGLEFGRIGTVPQDGDAFLLPPAGTLPVPDGTVPLCLAENQARTGIALSPDFDPQGYDGPAVKTLAMFPEYATGYDPEAAHSEPENILFRAVTDRSVRLILLAPLTDAKGELVTEPDAYGRLLETLSARLSARGLRAGGRFSCLDAPARSGWLAAGMSLFPAAQVALFLEVQLPAGLFSPWYVPLLLAESAVCVCGGLLFSNALLQLAALGNAVLAGCYAGHFLLRRRTSLPRPEGRAQRPVAVQYTAALLGLMVHALGGGLVAGALLADRSYLWGFAVFRGVKLSQLLPVLYTGGVLAFALRSSILEDLARRRTRFSILGLVLAAGAALALLVLRSGDNLLQAGPLERDFRNALELLLYARPRTKEFLLAFPALALYVLACEKRADAVVLLLGIIASVGGVSVVNTFCHLFTPLRVSLARTALSVLFGLLLGQLLLALVKMLEKHRREPRHL